MATYLVNLFANKNAKQPVCVSVVESGLSSQSQVEESLVGSFIMSYLGHDYYCKKAEIIRVIK